MHLGEIAKNPFRRSRDPLQAQRLVGFLDREQLIGRPTARQRPLGYDKFGEFRFGIAVPDKLADDIQARAGRRRIVYGASAARKTLCAAAGRCLERAP
jgi:hypothetical protein